MMKQKKTHRPPRPSMACRGSTGRMTKIEEIGEAVSFFASDRAAMITGQTLAVDGGLLTGFGEDLRSVVRQRMEAKNQEVPDGYCC